tara:strand:- start:4059 stop:4631 length:573 start_codon:yes stop_codon:yes gene_type:complete
MSLVGFARVSTRVQDLSSQIEALKAAGCEDIFHGKQSGASLDNDIKLSEMVNYIRKNDVVVVTKLDRLGRSLRSILSTIDAIHGKKATLRSLDGAIDTSNNSPFAKAQLSLIGTFAQLERDLIIDRTSEGRERAIKAGVEFGRPPKLSNEEKKTIKKLYADGDGKTMQELANKYNVSRMTISRVVRKENG